MARVSPRTVFFNSHFAWFDEKYQREWARPSRRKHKLRFDVAGPWYDSLSAAARQPYDDAANAGLSVVQGLREPPGERPVNVPPPPPPSDASEDSPGNGNEPSEQPADPMDIDDNNEQPTTEAPTPTVIVGTDTDELSNLPFDPFKFPGPLDIDSYQMPIKDPESPHWLVDPPDLSGHFMTWYNTELWGKWYNIAGKRWLNLGLVGRGAFGIACLAVRLDRDGNITHRIVRKDQHWALSNWLDRSKWKDNVPLEIHLHHKLTMTGNPFIHPFLGWSIDPRNRRTTIYSHLAKFGTLYRIRTIKWANGEHIYLPTDASDRHIPMAFLWYIAYALASAAMVMKHGSTTPGSDPNWKPIIHRDMKLDNVLLGEEMETALLEDPATAGLAFPYYPQPWLADFGLSFEEPQDEWAYLYKIDRSRGEFPQIAPEMRLYGPEPDFSLGEGVTSQANVFSIGYTLWSFASGHIPGRTNSLADPGDKRWRRLALHGDGAEEVSELWPENVTSVDPDFIRLLCRCMEFNPWARPTVEELYAETIEWIAKKKAAPIYWTSRPHPHYHAQPDYDYEHKLIYLPVHVQTSGAIGQHVPSKDRPADEERNPRKRPAEAVPAQEVDPSQEDVPSEEFVSTKEHPSTQDVPERPKRIRR